MDVMRRVVTLFEARGAGQIRASLGEMRSGFAGYRREIDQASRSTGYVNNQLRALGTTLRYAFAGQAIFGTLQMVRNLSEFESRLGEISSIATGPGGLPIVGQQLDQLGEDLLRVSNETAQPISDLQEGVLNLYSTIGDVPPDQASEMMRTISETAITAQSNIADTTQALLGMLDAFGRGTNELPKFGDEFYRVIQLSAGMPGRIYAQQLGRLSASATLGQFTPEQMGALAIGATRSGGSAATNMRGLAQLMTFVMNPSGTRSEAAFRSIGLGRQERQRLGGYQTLMRVLEIAHQRGVQGGNRGLTEDQVSALQETFGDNPTNAQLGLSGEGSALLAQLFPRIEGRRIAAVLSRLQTPEQVAGTPNKTIDQYLGDVTNSAGEMDRAMSRAMDRKRIQQAGNAMHNFGIEVGIALAPLLSPAARGITWGTSAFSNQKWGVPISPWGGHITGKELELAGGGAGIMLLLRRLRGGGARTLMGGASGLMAGTDLLTQHQRGYTPASPLYVWVVGSMGGWMPGDFMRRPGNPATGGGEYGVPGGRIGPPRNPAEIRNAERGAARRAGMRLAGSRALRYLPLIGTPFILNDIASAYYGPGIDEHAAIERKARRDASHPLLKYLTSSALGANRVVPGVGVIPGTTRLNPAEGRIIERLKSGQITAETAERMLRNVTTQEHLKAAGIQVKGKAEITIHDDRTGKKVHVTTDLFPDFTTPAPQTKAKNKSYRGNP